MCICGGIFHLQPFNRLDLLLFSPHSLRPFSPEVSSFRLRLACLDHSPSRSKPTARSLIRALGTTILHSQSQYQPQPYPCFLFPRSIQCCRGSRLTLVALRSLARRFPRYLPSSAPPCTIFFIWQVCVPSLYPRCKRSGCVVSVEPLANGWIMQCTYA